MHKYIFKYVYPNIFEEYFLNEIYWFHYFKRNISNYYEISHYYYDILDLLSGNLKYILNDDHIISELFSCIIHCDILELFQYIHNSNIYVNVLMIYYGKWYRNYNRLLIDYNETGYLGDNIKNYLLSIKYLH